MSVELEPKVGERWIFSISGLEIETGEIDRVTDKSVMSGNDTIDREMLVRKLK